MTKLRKTLFVAFGLGASVGTASGNAFNINEHDARVTGRGGATAASNSDPSAIVFNPGGIAIGQGTSIAIGGSLYVAEGSYDDGTSGKTKTDSAPSVVPNFYVTSRVHDMIAIGLGVHLPFGLAVSYPEGHQQRDIVQDQDLRTFFISPTVGVNLTKQVPGLSFGVGLDIVPATVELQNSIIFGDTEGTAHLAGDALGIGFRGGVMYHPPKVKGLKLGVMYRSKVKLDFEGEGDFDIGDPYRGQLPPDGVISTTITLPQTVAGGIAYSPVKNLELEFNAVWINWAQAFENNDLTINLPDSPSGTANASVAPQGYSNTVSYRFGIDYTLPRQRMGLRAGFIYDPTPISNEALTARLPDINRKNVTIGASKAFGNYGVHAAALWVTPGERDTSTVPFAPTFKGTYGVQAFVFSLGFNGTFGGKAAPDVGGSAKVAKK